MSTSAAWSERAIVKTTNGTSLECNSPVRKEHEALASWVDLFTRDVIAILGILGNIVLIKIRMQKHLRNTFNKLLIALAIFDISTLAIFLIISFLKNSKEIFHILFPYLLWPFVHIAANGSTIMTVVIAYERFMALRKPLHFMSEYQRHRVITYVTFVTITDTIINIPKFFEYEPTDCNGIRYTKFYTNKIYSVYNIVLHKLLLSAFIILVLIYMYASIYRSIKQSNMTGTRHSVRGAASSEESMRKKESKQARIFSGVVIACLVCHISDVFVTIAQIIQYIQDTTDPPLWYLIALKIRDMLVILNSAINIVIYTCLSKQFRGEFKTMFKLKSQNPTTSVALNNMNMRDIHHLIMCQ